MNEKEHVRSMIEEAHRMGFFIDPEQMAYMINDFLNVLTDMDHAVIIGLLEAMIDNCGGQDTVAYLKGTLLAGKEN